MKDKLKDYKAYTKSMEVWNRFWIDADYLVNDTRGREILKQLTRSLGSVSANIEEGFGRGFGKEFAMFLRYSRGSARESKGWFERASQLLPKESLKVQISTLDEIGKILTATIITLEKKQAKTVKEG